MYNVDVPFLGVKEFYTIAENTTSDVAFTVDNVSGGGGKIAASEGTFTLYHSDGTRPRGGR